MVILTLVSESEIQIGVFWILTLFWAGANFGQQFISLSLVSGILYISDGALGTIVKIFESDTILQKNALSMLVHPPAVIE